MASVLSPPSLYATRSPVGGGILLNPSPYRLPSPLPQSSYPSRSNQSLSSSTSSSEDVNTPPSSDHATPPPSLVNSLALHYTSDGDHVLRSRRSSAPEYGSLRSRRIRFAPLPDPRRAVLVTERGEELPLPSVFDEDDPSGIPHPNLHNFHTSASAALLEDSIVSPKKLPIANGLGPSSARVHTTRACVSSPPSPNRAQRVVPPITSTATVTETASRTSASSARLAKRLFKPFGQKSGDPHRTSSRDSSSSREDNPPSFGIPLGHWVSADEGSRTTSTNGEPLSRVRSAASTAQPKPKRMLNGRVYGARKNHRSSNVFQNIADEEPAFVEWGYGGMGSVGAGGMWSKVQSDQKLFIGQTEGRGRRGAPESGANDDDGSGMGWVKKRREERERKKREELAASEAGNKTDVGSAPTPVSAPVPVPGTAHNSIVVSVNHDITTIAPVLPETEDDDESSEEEDEEVDDESSSTEQEDDDGAQVRYLPSSHHRK
ncbi:hypothetical protein DFH94DRAFT_747588 [Russula ochroleuca]|jgi:hypothetical protein|uniref:Uncharacterized protein n=1 Tax=Russula ochroleuca TaxID=152965 RepID=A0A9P5MUF3_9AGAM|nr:hypothetical protein DFH94DRAFT_747588 [Russula ochroleuca]